MLKPFIWMFKQIDFKSYWQYFILLYFKFVIIAIIIAGIAYKVTMHYSIISIILSIIAVLCLITPCIYILGYFWELTENIINRELDIWGESIYNGKLKEVYKITLPELNTKTFLIRGMASIVATFLILIPCAILLSSGTFIVSFSNLPQENLLVIVAFIYFFLPALFWNYADKNSIFAVWNIRKAIYIIGNYTGRYFLNVILLVIFNVICFLFFSILFKLLQFNDLIYNIQNPITIILCFLYLTIYYIINIYILHVNAYLLGTITQVGEQ